MKGGGGTFGNRQQIGADVRIYKFASSFGKYPFPDLWILDLSLYANAFLVVKNLNIYVSFQVLQKKPNNYYNVD